MRCEARTLDDIRALGGNDAADERRFATAARVSEINLALYRTFAQPMVRAMTSAPVAESMRQLHPLRLQYELFSDANPLMAPVKAMAERVRKDRQAGRRRQSVPRDAGSGLEQIVAGLDAWREMTEISERANVSVGLRLACAAGGRGHRSGRCATVAEGANKPAASRAPAVPHRRTEIAHRQRGLARVPGPRPALCWHGARPSRRTRACGHSAVCGPASRTTGRSRPWPSSRRSCASNTTCCWSMRRRRSPPFPISFRPIAEGRRQALTALRRVLSAAGDMTGEAAQRLERIAGLFGVGSDGAIGKPKLAAAS